MEEGIRCRSLSLVVRQRMGSWGGSGLVRGRVRAGWLLFSRARPGARGVAKEKLNECVDVFILRMGI